MIRPRMRPTRAAALLLLITLCVALVRGAPQAEAQAPAAGPPALSVSANGRFLQRADGAPFFWMGDTAWHMLNYSTRAEAEQYLLNRQGHGFNVIYSLLISEDSFTIPTAQGQSCYAMTARDPLRLNECYMQHVDWVIARAGELGLYMAFLPTWGDLVTGTGGAGPTFTPASARAFGKLLGARYRGATNLVWVLGGDRPVQNQTQEAVWNEMADGLREGLGGANPLLFYHPSQFWPAADTFHGNARYDLNAWQSGHSALDVPTWEYITKDYARTPAKPVFDSEPAYEDHPINFNGPGFFRDYEVRRQIYRAVFAGGFGATYGNNAVWQWYAPGRTPVWSPERPWYEALDRPAATQMIHLRRLMESRPFFTRVPDQSLLVSPAGSGIEHVRATRDSDGRYAMVYLPTNRAVTVAMSKLRDGPVTAWWYDPRTGAETAIGSFANSGSRTFTPPAGGPDWVLVLDDSRAIYAPPSAEHMLYVPLVSR